MVSICLKKLDKKISISNKGRKVSEETRQKISDGNKGKKRSKEYIEKMKIRVSGKNSGKARAVRCVETGEVFDTITEANKKYKCKHISLVCQGKRTSAGKLNGKSLHWEYV